MDPVDVLTMAVHAAQLIRSAADPEAVIAGAYSVFERKPPRKKDDDMAIRIVRLLVELDTPVLFTIETGGEPWRVWDICCAFADQYARIYENPDGSGVSMHDLTDLWIEGLIYYPEVNLLYPHVGS